MDWTDYEKRLLPAGLRAIAEERDDAVAINILLHSAEALERRDVCLWKQDEDDGAWDTQCGNRFEIIEGDPLNNNMAFCPYCGKLLGIALAHVEVTP